MNDVVGSSVLPQPNGWTFLTNHAHVLFCIARDPEVRLRDVALRVGITERAVQRIVTDLEEEGYLTVFKAGRRNRYVVQSTRSLRHPVERHCTVQSLIELVLGPMAAPRLERLDTLEIEAALG
jgi:DNA-binding MarR family transcriptional regulator